MFHIYKYNTYHRMVKLFKLGKIHISPYGETMLIVKITAAIIVAKDRELAVRLAPELRIIDQN